MKKARICKHCHTGFADIYLCDTCEKDLLKEFDGVPITHELDGEEYHFCDYTCLLKFVIEELKKTQPKDDRFEYGER